MEEAGSSSARGRKPYTRARAKLADSSDARHGEAGFFSSARRKKRSTRIEVGADSSGDDPGRRVVVDLISSGNDSVNNSGDDSGNNSGDNSGNNSGDDSEDHEEVAAHDIDRIWTEINKLKESAEEKQEHTVTRDDIDFISKGIDKQDEQLKAAQKRQEIELLKKNAELAERVAKLETRIAEINVAAQKKPSS